MSNVGPSSRPETTAVTGRETDRGTVVELHDVGRTFGEHDGAVVALRDIELTVKRAERVALVGPSGSGKTTLLGLIGLLDLPTVGDVSLFGESAAVWSEDKRAEARRAHIGFVFQLFHLIPGLSALDNVTAPLAPYAPHVETSRRARSLLTELGLEGRMHHHPGQLSGGEQQRVALARALINNPQLLLADEPTGNLDSGSGGRVVELLGELHAARDFTLIVATHDDHLASSLDRRIHLLDGRITTG